MVIAADVHTVYTFITMKCKLSSVERYNWWYHVSEIAPTGCEGRQILVASPQSVCCVNDSSITVCGRDLMTYEGLLVVFMIAALICLPEAMVMTTGKAK